MGVLAAGSISSARADEIISRTMMAKYYGNEARDLFFMKGSKEYRRENRDMLGNLVSREVLRVLSEAKTDESPECVISKEIVLHCVNSEETGTSCTKYDQTMRYCYYEHP